MWIFEAIMLICFGAAWPFSIVKSYRSRQTGGKSLAFLVVIFVGYISGLIYKLNVNFDGVTWLYMLNGLLVGLDIALYLRNARLERTQTLIQQ